MSLKYRRQASADVAKANQLLVIIRHSLELIDETTLPRLYKALVRPHLEFGNMAWGPFNWADQLLVEWVQRRAICLVAFVKHQPYEEHLEVLKLPSMFYWYHREDKIQMCQIIHQNSLPQSVDGSDSINQFKSRLDVHSGIKYLIKRQTSPKRLELDENGSLQVKYSSKFIWNLGKVR